MKAMVLRGVHDLRVDREPLTLEELPDPAPRAGEILVRVGACGVCHTDLDVIEGRTPPARLPLVPGHQVVGAVAAVGEGASPHRPGDRVGIAWINSAGGACGFCAVGLFGFGASGHLVLRVVRSRFPRSRVHVFSRTPGERAFALELGAAWAGDFGEAPPEPLDCAIDTTPAWAPVVAGLRALRPGGRLVVNAIRKEEADKDALASLDYPRDLWLEKELVSVANIARADVAEFLAFAAAAGIRPEVGTYPLAEANRALLDLKERRIRGAKVLRVWAKGSRAFDLALSAAR